MKKSLSLLLLLVSLGLGCFTYSVETLAASVSGEARIADDMPAPKRVVKPIPATKSIVRKQIAKLKADLMTLNLSIKSIEKKLALSKKGAKSTLILEARLTTLRDQKVQIQSEIDSLQTQLTEIQAGQQ